MATKASIRVGNGVLVLRDTGNVLWVRDVDATRGKTMDTGVLLATSAPGCAALGEALQEMADIIRGKS